MPEGVRVHLVHAEPAGDSDMAVLNRNNWELGIGISEREVGESDPGIGNSRASADMDRQTEPAVRRWTGTWVMESYVQLGSRHGDGPEMSAIDTLAYGIRLPALQGDRRNIHAGAHRD